MNEQIKEYRKASAKELFHHEQIRHSIELCEVRYRNEWHEWCPDTDLSQMGMIVDKLRKEIVILFCFWRHGCNCNFYKDHHDLQISKHFISEGENVIELAFMKAFMEYIKTK